MKTIMDTRTITYNISDCENFIIITYCEVISNVFKSSSKTYIINSYKTEKDIKKDLYKSIIEDFNFEEMELPKEFYNTLHDLLNNLCVSLKFMKLL